MRTKPTSLLLLACLSGVFGINYEVLYFRLITARFGDMLHVQAGILAMFLLGVAIGALAGAKLRRLWLLELLVGATAILLGAALPLIETAPWLGWVLQRPVVAAGFCMMLVAVPAILVGCSVPLFTEYLALLARDQSGRIADAPFRRVYTLYNLGAAASVLVTEFLLIRTLGNSGTLHGLAWGNIAIGIALFLLFPELRAPQIPDRASGAAALDRGRSAGLILIGCASSLFQMTFVRGAMEILGNTRGVFALTLALVMLGFPLGVRLSRRLSLAGVVHLGTIGMAVGFILLPWLQGVHVAWLPSLAGSTVLGTPLGRVLWQLAILIPVGLPAFICFGAVLPVLLKGLPSGVHVVGRAMFLNGIGNAAGFILFIGLVHDLLPELGHLLAAILVAQLGLLIASGPGAYRRTPANPYPAAAAFAVVILTLTFSSRAYYAHHLLARGMYRWDDSLSGPGTMTLQMAREGATNAGLIRFRDEANLEGKLLFYSGHSSIFATERGQINRAEVLSGVLPAVFAPSLRRAAVIGVGTGITAGTTALLFDHTDAVEINPAVLALLPGFADANFDLARNPKARVVYNDARIFLATSPPVYDVILNSVSVPSFEAASKIYTTEFFARAKRSLVEGGVYMTWVAMNDLALLAVVGSLRRSFQHCAATYLSPGYLMLACADHPVRPRPLSSVSLPPEVSRVLEQYAGAPASAAEVVDGLHLSDDFLPTLPKLDLENTDDRPEAEFAFGDPRIPSTLLQRWPRRHPQFVATDLPSGTRLGGVELWRRCSLYKESNLREVCDSLPDVDEQFIVAQLNSVGLPPADVRPEERLRAMATRRRVIESVLARGLGGASLQRERDSLVLSLADLTPNDGEVQAAAGQVLERQGDARLARLRRYRAIVLDHRYRRYQQSGTAQSSPTVTGLHGIGR